MKSHNINLTRIQQALCRCSHLSGNPPQNVSYSENEAHSGAALQGAETNTHWAV